MMNNQCIYICSFAIENVREVIPNTFSMGKGQKSVNSETQQANHLSTLASTNP